MARNYLASDYAGIVSKNLEAYYGYEETTDDGEWCLWRESEKPRC